MTKTEIARIAAGRDDALLSFADSIVEFTAAGGTIEELRATIAQAQAPAKVRKPKAAKKAVTVKSDDISLDPTVGNGASMRMTLAGRMMPTDKLIQDGQFNRITKFFTVDAIVAAAHKLGFTGSLRTLSIADASDLYSTLKAA